VFRYIGSKASTVDAITKIIGRVAKSGTVADAFGGLGTVGAALKERGYQVTTCDVLAFPHAFQTARIEAARLPSFPRLGKDANSIARSMNRVKDPSSEFVLQFSKRRQFFTRDNASKIAGGWRMIKRWDSEGLITRREKKILLASLINSADEVANTAGTYYAYLKNFDRKAIKPYSFKWLSPSRGKHAGTAIYGDALESLKGKKYDVLYLDPPYNHRDYARYYHLPESIAGLGELDVNAQTLSGVPTQINPATKKIRKGASLSYIESLLSEVKWKFAIVHYCDDALIPLSELRKALLKFGRVRCVKVAALGYTTSSKARAAEHYVYVITKSKKAPRRSVSNR